MLFRSLWLALILTVVAGHYAGAWEANHVLPQSGLLLLTLLLLFGPRVLAVMWTLADPLRRTGFGGSLNLIRSAIADTLMSIAIAPINMLAQTGNLFGILSGRKAAWSGQTRDRDGLGLIEALGLYKYHVGVGAGLTAFALATHFDLLWLSPIIAGLLAAPIIAAISARKYYGRVAARLGLFQVPQPWWISDEGRGETIMRISWRKGFARRRRAHIAAANDS